MRTKIFIGTPDRVESPHLCNNNLQNKMKNETPLNQTTMTIEESLQSYLKIFWPLLLRLMDTNLVIGGSFALMIHGLKMRSNPEDLDIILYFPTEYQKKYLEAMRFFDQTPEGKEYKDVDNRRSYKFYKDGKQLNLVCWSPKEKEDNLPLLSFYYEGCNIKVQSIGTVIEAKKFYSREKDLQHFLDLKNLNF